jgi:hypothetical protein
MSKRPLKGELIQTGVFSLFDGIALKESTIPIDTQKSELQKKQYINNSEKMIQ